MTNGLKHGYGFGGVMERTIPVELRRGSPSAITFADEDERWMHEALLAAMEQIGVPSPNPTVGCVIVKDGQMIATGATERFGGLHAERAAIEGVADRALLQGASAYVTLEPCCHHGKQPPCTDALIEAGIARCVVAVTDAHRLVAGGGIGKLRAAGCQVTLGTLGEEAKAFHYPFLAAQSFNRPIFIGKWAQTIDALLADDDGNARWISSPSSRAYTHWLRQKFDAIMVGAGTLLADIPALNVRSCAQPINRHPLKIVFDPSARLLSEASPELCAKVLATTFCPSSKTVYAACAKAYQHGCNQALLHSDYWDGSQHILRLTLNDDEPVSDLVAQLGGSAVTRFNGLPLQSVFIEGGARLVNLFMDRDLIDCFHTFIAPCFLGASRHRIATPVAGDGLHPSTTGSRFPQKCPTMHRHRLMTAYPLGEDVLMEYVPEDRWAKIFKEVP